LPLHPEQPSLQISGVLRNQILELCSASGVNVNQVLQAFVDCLVVAVITTASDADTAADNLDQICGDMRRDIREAYAEYHEMAKAQGKTQQ
jgi:hypothetical protein